LWQNRDSSLSDGILAQRLAASGKHQRAVLREGGTAPHKSKGRQKAGQSPGLSMKFENVDQNTGINRKEEKKT